MPLIDTDKIAKQFGNQGKELVDQTAADTLSTAKSLVELLQTKDLVITISLKDRVG